MIVRRWASCAGLVAFAVAFAAANRSSEAQVATIRVSSVNDLLSQARTVIESAPGGDANPVSQVLNGLENGNALKGFDRTKPLVITLNLEPSQQGGPLGTPVIAVYVPVKSQADVLDTLKGVGVQFDDQPGVEGFSHKVKAPAPNAPAAYIVAEPPAGYSVVTNVPANAAKFRSINPAALGPKSSSSVVVGTRMDRIPDALKGLFLQSFNQNIEKSRARNAGEPDAQFEARIGVIDMLSRAISSFVTDGRELEFTWNVDPKTGRFGMELAADATPGSTMAGAVDAFAKRNSIFSGLATGSALNLVAVVPIPDSLRTVIQTQIKRAREEIAKRDQSDRLAFNHLLDSFEPTLTGAEVDTCVVLDSLLTDDAGKGKNRSNVVLMGVRLNGAKKLEATLRDLVATKMKPDDQKKIALDFAKAADGTAIHRITLDDDQFKKTDFMEPVLFVAFTEKAGIYAVGSKGLDAIKQAIESLKRPATAPQLGLQVEARRFAQLDLDEKSMNREAARKAAGEIFTGPNADKDHLGVTLSAEGNRMRLSVVADLPALRFLAEIGAADRKKRAEPGGQ